MTYLFFGSLGYLLGFGVWWLADVYLTKHRAFSTLAVMSLAWAVIGVLASIVHFVARCGWAQ